MLTYRLDFQYVTSLQHQNTRTLNNEKQNQIIKPSPYAYHVKVDFL